MTIFDNNMNGDMKEGLCWLLHLERNDDDDDDDDGDDDDDDDDTRDKPRKLF